MIDSKVMALAAGGLHAAHRTRLARHQGSPALAAHESIALLGAVHPRERRTSESII
jgi:hypothetical protein